MWLLCSRETLFNTHTHSHTHGCRPFLAKFAGCASVCLAVSLGLIDSTMPARGSAASSWHSRPDLNHSSLPPPSHLPAPSLSDTSTDATILTGSVKSAPASIWPGEASRRWMAAPGVSPQEGVSNLESGSMSC